MSMFTTIVVSGMALGRIALGIAPFVAAGPASRTLGFPASHDNATSRLMGRLFGVRDVGLGVLALWALQHPEALPFVLLFNAAMDAGFSCVRSSRRSAARVSNRSGRRRI